MKNPVALMHYAILACILSVGIIMFLSLSGNPTGQLFSGIVTSVSYVFWGLIHHKLNGDLHKKVVVEYLLIGAIAIIILLTVLVA